MSPRNVEQRRSTPYRNVQTSTGGEARLITDDLGVFAPMTTSGDFGDLHVEMTIDLVSGRLECVALSVRHLRGGTVTTELLRTVPVHRLVQVHVGGLLLSVTRTPESLSFEPLDMSKPAGFPDDGPTDENLRFIANVYRWAFVTGDHPTKAVEQLGLPRATAGRWIARARPKFLGTTMPGRAGDAPPKRGKQ